MVKMLGFQLNTSTNANPGGVPPPPQHEHTIYQYTSGPGSKSGCARGPPLTSNFCK